MYCDGCCYENCTIKKSRKNIESIKKHVEFEVFRKLLLFRDREFQFRIRIEELVQILISV